MIPPSKPVDHQPSGATGDAALRAVTWLSPGIPQRFFELVAGHVGAALGRPVSLRCEQRSSGPMHGDHDPFAAGEADLGFLCSPSYLYLRALARPSVELVPAGFVFRDPRAAGRPVYFSDVVVRADSGIRRLLDLAGRRWAYNDECSLSGYFAARQRLHELGYDDGFFAWRLRAGSHHASIAAVLAGDVDAAAIDSTVLAALRRARPELATTLRVVESWGPFPVQPVVTRSDLGAAFARRVAAALLALPRAVETSSTLGDLGLERCAPLSDDDYLEERRALCALGELPDQPDQPDHRDPRTTSC